MHLAFIALLSGFFIISIFSIFVFFRAAQLAEKINIKVVEKSLNKKRILRFCAVSTIIICCILSAIYLPQTRYGSYLMGKSYFDRFLKTHTIETAEKAFSLWQRSANKEAFAEAFDKIPQNSHAWKSFIRRSSGLYYEKGNLNSYVQYLLEIEKKLQHPIPQSTLYFELGSVYQKTDPEKAENYFDKVLSLKGDKEDMERARGNIHEMQNLNIGQKVPDFELTTINGQKIILQELQGKVVLLDFWSIHCGACILEIPTLQNIYQSNKSKEFVMLGISLDYGDDVVQFIQEKKLAWQHVMVDMKVSREILDTFNIQYVPYTYLIDTKGNIVSKNLRGKELEEAIDKLVN